jgi:hypothetical protein
MCMQCATIAASSMLAFFVQPHPAEIHKDPNVSRGHHQGGPPTSKHVMHAWESSLYAGVQLHSGAGRSTVVDS